VDKLSHRLLQWSVVIFFGLFLSACTSQNNFAPVRNGWSDTQAASQTYRVQPDDTLYSIAFRFGLDYRALADANKINAPYHIVVGQTLKLLPQADNTLTSPEAVQTPVTPVVSVPVTTVPVSSAPAATPTTSPAQTVAPTGPAPKILAVNGKGPVGKWLWPAKGGVIHTFSNGYGANKGIDITGKAGDSVKATAAGKVVYLGTGLRGYGLLIIVKHNAEYLSAYAHNSKALVKEGANVKAGQVIALMGSSDASQPLLHFEIRKAGSPIDPLTLLPPR
jgi:lipoprotein NlpD